MCPRVQKKLNGQGGVPKISPKLQGRNMKIDKRSKECVYITINGWVYYIDDSTGEQILQKWKEEDK